MSNNNAFRELSEEETQAIDGGIAWLVVGFACVCVGAFALGVWNGYHGR